MCVISFGAYYPSVITATPSTSACAANILSAVPFLTIISSDPAKEKVPIVVPPELVTVTNLTVVPELTSLTSLALSKVDDAPELGSDVLLFF